MKNPRRSRRGVAVGATLALVAAGVSASIFLFTRSRAPTGNEETAPEPIPVERIAWPGVRREAEAAFADARRGLEHGLALYSAGDRAAGDAKILESLGALERCGALVPEVGGYHYQTVTTPVLSEDLREAEKRALRWLEKFPEDFDHLFLLGQIRHKQRAWAKAAESFRAAALARPRSVDPLRWLAHTCAQLGAQEEGVRTVKEALERIGYPGDGYWLRPLAPKVLGTALMVLHRFQEYGLLAEVAAEHLRRFPRNPEAVMAGGVALAELGRFEEAEPLLREALLHPANSADAEEIAFSLGVALAKQAKWSEAAGVLTTLLAKDPHFAKAYHQLGLVFSRLGRTREAEAMHATSRELAPSEREMRREIEMRGAGEPGRAAAARALALTLRGEPREAERILRAGDLRDEPYAVFALADFYIDALRASDAERVLAQAEKLAGPGHDDVLGRRALVLDLRGERETAFAILRSLTSREGATSFWRTTFARLLIEERRLDEAVKLLEPAAKAGIDQAAAHFLGRALLEKGDAARALQVLRAVSPGDTRWKSWDGGAWLARAYLEAEGNADEADRLLREAAPSSRSARAHLLARALLAERRAAPGDAAAAAEARDARAALERIDSIEPSVTALRRRIAAAAWPGSGPLYLSLARLVASRGDTRGAVRLGRLALAAEPRSAEVLRSLEGWLREDGDVFFRLRALRDLLEVSPGDEAAREAIREIESRWLAPAGTSP